MGFSKLGKAHRNGDVPIGNARYVVVDTELTGLNDKWDSIVSIGAIKMLGGRIELGNTFYKLVNPEKKLTSDSVVIHEITPSEVSAKPDIDSVLLEFLDFCGEDVILGHCLAIDLAFLNREAKRVLGAGLPNSAVDTFAVYGSLRKRLSSHRAFSVPLKDYKLDAMARSFGVQVQGSHNAMMDAYITAQLFQRFIPLLIEAGIQNLGDLLKAGDPSKGGDINSYSGEVCNF